MIDINHKMFRQILRKYAQNTALENRLLCAVIPMATGFAIASSFALDSFISDKSDKTLGQHIKNNVKVFMPVNYALCAIFIPDITLPVGLAILAVEKIRK